MEIEDLSQQLERARSHYRAALFSDTSVWVAYLRPGSDYITMSYNSALERHEVLACDPAVAELAAGARPEDRSGLPGPLAGLPWATWIATHG